MQIWCLVSSGGFGWLESVHYLPTFFTLLFLCCWLVAWHAVVATNSCGKFQWVGSSAFVHEWNEIAGKCD